MTQSSPIEKAILLVVENAAGNPKIKTGQFPSLDQLAARGQSGFLSTFNNCEDTITQLVGVNYHSPENLRKDIGSSMKICVLKTHTTIHDIVDIEPIEEKSVDDINSTIIQKLSNYTMIIVETLNLDYANQIAGFLLPKINELSLAVSLVVGYKQGATIPTFPVPPIVNPSWKIIGPNTVKELSVEHPMFYITASKQLTRTDHVKSFDEDDIEHNNCMGCMPICQFFREFSYYTGSSWKYGA